MQNNEATKEEDNSMTLLKREDLLSHSILLAQIIEPKNLKILMLSYFYFYLFVYSPISSHLLTIQQLIENRKKCNNSKPIKSIFPKNFEL